MNTEHDDKASTELETHPPGDESAAQDDDREAVAEPVPAPARPRRRGGLLAFFSFLFSVAALALVAWVWWQGQTATDDETRVFTEIARLDRGDDELRLRIKEVRDEIDMLASGDITAEFRALQERMESDRAQLARLEQRIGDELALSRSLQAATDSMQNRLEAAEAAVTGMATRELDAGGELDVAEVDYLLRLANERLKLFGDPAAADDALEVADLHLASLDNPVYFGVRQEIAASRRDLAGLEVPDYQALANRLDDLQGRIPDLEFRGEEAARAETAEASGEGWWEKTKGVFGSLVTVRRATDAEGRLSIEDKDYVRQRVWLQVEIAHLALMRRDEDAFRSALARVKESVETWFAEDNDTFKAVSDEIDALSAIEIEPEVPDITGAWQTLQLLGNTRPGPAAPAIPPAADATEAAASDEEAGG